MSNNNDSSTSSYDDNDGINPTGSKVFQRRDHYIKVFSRGENSKKVEDVLKLL